MTIDIDAAVLRYTKDLDAIEKYASMLTEAGNIAKRTLASISNSCVNMHVGIPVLGPEFICEGMRMQLTFERSHDGPFAICVRKLGTPPLDHSQWSRLLSIIAMPQVPALLEAIRKSLEDQVNQMLDANRKDLGEMMKGHQDGH